MQPLPFATAEATFVSTMEKLVVKPRSRFGFGFGKKVPPKRSEELMASAIRTFAQAARTRAEHTTVDTHVLTYLQRDLTHWKDEGRFARLLAILQPAATHPSASVNEHIIPMPGDGNCMLHAFSHELSRIGAPRTPVELREDAARALREQRRNATEVWWLAMQNAIDEYNEALLAENTIEGLIPLPPSAELSTAVTSYIDKTTHDGFYLAQPSLTALAQTRQVNVTVHSTYKGQSAVHEITTADDSPTIHLFYSGGNHYDAYRP